MNFCSHFSGFIAYGFIATVLALVLIFYYGPRYGKVNILVYIAICSLIGSISVMGCKGVGIVLKQTFDHNNEFDNPLSWGLIFVVAFCGTTQINYLNKALDIFNTSLVTPIYYVMFTTLTIIASAILFQEWEIMGTKDVIGTFCGFLTIVLGVFLLHAFKDIKFSVAWSTADNKDERQNRGTICWELWNSYVKQCEQRWRLIGWGNNSFSNFQQFQSYLMKLCFKHKTR